MKYRKRPVVIEAEPFDLDQFLNEQQSDYIARWVESCTRPDCVEARGTIPNHYVVQTPEGPADVSNGDWIITGVKGDHYPCKPDIFAATYEPAPGTANVVPDPLDTITGLQEEIAHLRDVRIPSMWKHWGDALDNLAKLEAAGKRLRDLVELGQTDCPCGPPHCILGEEATDAVLGWDRSSRHPASERTGHEESGLAMGIGGALHSCARTVTPKA